MLRSGEPFTENVPPSKSRSSADTSSWCATICPSLRDHLLPGVPERDPADRERPRAVRVHPELRRGSVPVNHLDVIDSDAELIGDDLREGRLVALTVRRRARDDLDGAERLEAHRRGVPAPTA